MTWFNWYGLVGMLVIMIPNMLFAYTHRDGFENKFQNKTLELAEQIGRFGCFGFMLVNIPYLCRGYWFAAGKSVYLIVGAVLVLVYCIGWMVFWKTNSLAKALLLSIVPSVLFLFCGVLTRNIPLILFSLLFAPCHIAISVKNT